jgi:hypothetical protein
MAEKSAPSGAKGVDIRRKWDKEEYAEKAKQKDDDEKVRMKENEERMKQGGPFGPPYAYAHAESLFARKEASQGAQNRRAETD